MKGSNYLQFVSVQKSPQNPKQLKTNKENSSKLRLNLILTNSEKKEKSESKRKGNVFRNYQTLKNNPNICLLYTSDAADDTPCVDLGGRRIIKKKNKQITQTTTKQPKEHTR
eukprot:TRINITY_DN61699_c0_g1_i3.p3 TRINITY_DN61699_c0_g1~~TRINITY_DN61699_c0_g1_i3.p3  ORF type:complete len:112 (+),score=21.10 TRINITY_DN61699_c0_g1_i3:467-802(+)